MSKNPGAAIAKGLPKPAAAPQKMDKAALRKFIRFFELKDEFQFRDPDQIHGMPFQIAKCERSDLYIHDHMS